MGGFVEVSTVLHKMDIPIVGVHATRAVEYGTMGTGIASI